MTEKRTGKTLLDKVGDTPGFTLRPGAGSKVIVQSLATRKQRTVNLLDAGREYDNAVKKLREIGWTFDLYEGWQEKRRSARLERSAGVEAEALRELQEREASDVPVPAAPGMDKVMNDLLTDALGAVDALKGRLRVLHQNNRNGEPVRPEAAMDLLTMHMASMQKVVDITDELRRRGMVAKSMR
ncbi:MULTISPECIES: hypothetical protein [Streptomyces]|uniref:hypothetical protein n=1 Tax=Streptomyces TaxID=1883 RepID=UPI00365FB27B